VRHLYKDAAGLAVAVALIVSLAGCGGSPESIRIGVMLPLTGPDAVGFRAPLEWARENVNAAGGIDGRPIELVYRDIGRNSVTKVANELARDHSITAVIGPDNSEDARRVVPIFISHRKPIISPAATSADLFRAFSGYRPDYFWRPVESDIAQVRAMLDSAARGGAHSVAMVSGDSPYGGTFFDWFGYLATEEGLRVTTTIRYPQEEQSCEAPLDRALASHADAVLAVPDHAAQATCMAREWRARGSSPRLIFSDSAQDPSLISALGSRADGIEGTGLSANPTNGFSKAFRARFHRVMSPYAANAYDSVLLVAYGLQAAGGHGGSDLAKAMTSIVAGRGQRVGWDRAAVGQSLAAIAGGGHPFVHGAVGPWRFDAASGVELVASTYERWTVRHREFDVAQYITTDNTATAKAGMSAQKTRATLRRAHAAIGGRYHPGRRTGSWALLVAASDGWENYRHQADVMAQYQRLRAGGVPADHIIVVAANDLAQSPQNRDRGAVRYFVGGADLIPGFHPDYRLEGMTAERLMDILSGKASAANPHVIRAGPHEDLYVYLAGHGNREGVYLGLGEPVPSRRREYSILTPKLLDQTVAAMAVRHAYRRMLIVVEACEGGVLGATLDAPGALLLSAASSAENSLSANYDPHSRTWLADQFSYKLWQAESQMPNTTLDDLYRHLYLTVAGSHVTAYGPRFGDAGNASVSEFLTR
jgi:ABC-type branched-subunit amino acid transport system substrate-binding protein/glycosylphosphatidylinositol transamidase (GPIT) subunit GPI8